ncbi:hypothetical protein NL676_003857 [Syzygium grande]|nr:hypothetical protein NL676_003857 [Syzygium grande]
MVMKKSLDNRTIGFQVPVVPRAPRSARRGRQKKRADGNYICAIELLASLAGKLLRESESSSASNNASEENHLLAICKDVTKQERQDVNKPLKAECIEQASCEESNFVSDRALENNEQKFSLQQSQSQHDPLLDSTSTFSGSAKSEKDSYLRPAICKNKFRYGMSGNLAGMIPGFGPSFGLNAEKPGTGDVNLAKCLKDSVENSSKYSAMMNIGDQVRKPLCGNPHPVASFPRRRNNINIGSRDGDENFPRFNKCSNKIKVFRHTQRIGGDRRIRKLLTSKYWRAAPKLKDCETSKADGEMKSFTHKRRTFYKRERYNSDCLYKRRKLLDRSSIVTFDGVFSGESNSSSPQKNMNGDRNGSIAMMHGESGTPSSVFGSQASSHVKDSHVKFSIKSFRIPELLIDVPETATVGSLKSTVVEAVSAILGSGLRVGILLRGKKIRDDNRTLLQTGISCKESLDNLGFALEPSLQKVNPAIASEDVPLTVPYDMPELLTSSPENCISDPGVSDVPSDPPPLTNSGNDVDTNPELISLHSDVSSDKKMSDLRALVPFTAMPLEPLAVVPLSQKNKRSELSQRRIRRPFSVSEVEALVQAVEELGTGRWRDVKLRAFENVDHRTYVDLKDKWKTLVHTASIAPQQRRGEPVPQDLLDRVMSAHAYWSQHQAKQQGKHQPATLKIANEQADRMVIEGM